MVKFRVCVVAVLLLATHVALATDIEGVQPAALDQPRVHLHLRRTQNGEPLSTGKKKDEKTINITAFLDTGASGVLLSKTTADALGVKTQMNGAKAVVFHDVGVGGSEGFDVSEPLFVYMAPSGKNGEPADASGYPTVLGPFRLQLGQRAGLMDMLTGGMDVIGMPSIHGRVMVMDPKPVDTFGDTMRAGLFQRGDSHIPKTDRHVMLSYGSFKRFTKLEPATAQGPTLADNPFVGPSPTGGKKDVKPIEISFNGKRATGSFLLDTGAAASMISSKLAAALGVTEQDGKLAGAPEAEQFSFTIGGVGGAKKSPGFRADALTLPTRENDPLVYKKAPLIVCDIEVEDPTTHEKLTLDGVLGMNYFVASANIEESALMPDINHMTACAYDWIVFDEPAAELGLKLKREFEKPGERIEIKPSGRKTRK